MLKIILVQGFCPLKIDNIPKCLTKAKQEFPNKYIVFQKGFNVPTANILHEMRKRKNFKNINFCGDVSLFLSLVKSYGLL